MNRRNRRWVASGGELLGHERELADAARPQPAAPQPVGGQQVVQRPAPICAAIAVASAANASISDSATARCDRLQSSCQRTTNPARCSSRCISSSGVSQTVSASGMRARSAADRGMPSSSVKANRPPPVSAREIALDQRRLVGKREHRLEQQHHLEAAMRQRRDLRDLEATGQLAGTRACDLDGACTGVDAKVAAAELARDEPSRPGDATAEVEHRHPRADAGPLRQRPDLAGAHEALLLDVLARRVGRLAGSPQGPHERLALVLPHGCPILMPSTIVDLVRPPDVRVNRTAAFTVVPFTWLRAEARCALFAAR